MRALIVTDTRLYREGLAALLERVGDIDCVDTADNVHKATALLVSTSPGVVLLDMAMPGSLEILRAIARTAYQTKAVALGVSEDDDHIIACAEAGAAGYLSREGSLDQLVATIQSVARGEVLCSPRLAAKLFRRVANLAAGHHGQSASERLSAREREIAGLLGRGLSNKEIASHLSIEVSTVKNHVHSIFEKLHVHRRGEAAARLRDLLTDSGALWP